MTDLQEQLTAAETAVTELEARLTSALRDVSTSTAAESSHADMRARADELMAALDAKSVQLADELGRSEVGRCMLKLIETRVESTWFQRLKQKNVRLLSSLAFNSNLRRYIEEAEAKCTAAEREVAGLTLALRAAKADADTGASFQDEVTQLHTALADETARAEAVAAKLADETRRSEAAEAQSTAAERKVEALESECTTAEREVASLTLKCTAAEREVASLSLTLRAAKADADTDASFQDEVTQLHEALAESLDLGKTEQTKRDELETQLEAAVELATMLKRSSATQESVASGKLSEVEQSLANTRSDLETLQRSSTTQDSAATAKLAEVEQSLADTRGELRDAQQTAQRSMSDMEVLKLSSTTQESESTAKLLDLEQSLTDTRSELETLQRSCTAEEAASTAKLLVGTD